MTVDLGPARVRAIKNHPGQYAVSFGQFTDLSIHVTPERWDAIDATVRAGIAAAAQQAVAS